MKVIQDCLLRASRSLRLATTQTCKSLVHSEKHPPDESGKISSMYHYNPATALEELTEEATLPNPVHVRDMMLRKKLSADQALELNRVFVEYQKFFGETQKLGKEILKRLAA